MKQLRRFVWYIAKRLFVLTLILGLLTVSFYFAMNASNIYIVLKDGMAKRAQVVMMGENEAELHKYFSESYLLRDPVLMTSKNGTNPYVMYNIKGIDHRLNMEWMWCWPWEDSARATITERIPAVDGRILASYKQTTPEANWPVPKWISGRFDVLLIKENGTWRIKNLELINNIYD